MAGANKVEIYKGEASSNVLIDSSFQTKLYLDIDNSVCSNITNCVNHFTNFLTRLQNQILSKNIFMAISVKISTTYP